MDGRGRHLHRLDLSLSQKHRGISTMNLEGRNAPGDDASSRNHRTFADLGPWPNHSPGTDPRSVFNEDLANYQREGGIGPVMIPSAQVGSLGDAHAVAQVDRREIIDPAVFAEPTV